MEKLRTYIVEDSPVIRENLIEALEENAPIEVVGVAEDERSAISWLMGHNCCDLVIVDIFLKDGSGLGVLKAIGELARTTRRVVLSNHATPDMRSKCLELGADQVFDKSNEIDELLMYFNRIGADRRCAVH